MMKQLHMLSQNAQNQLRKSTVLIIRQKLSIGNYVESGDFQAHKMVYA